MLSKLSAMEKVRSRRFCSFVYLFLGTICQKKIIILYEDKSKTDNIIRDGIKNGNYIITYQIYTNILDKIYPFHHQHHIRSGVRLFLGNIVLVHIFLFVGTSLWQTEY